MSERENSSVVTDSSWCLRTVVSSLFSGILLKQYPNNASTNESVIIYWNGNTFICFGDNYETFTATNSLEISISLSSVQAKESMYLYSHAANNSSKNFKALLCPVDRLKKYKTGTRHGKSNDKFDNFASYVFVEPNLSDVRPFRLQNLHLPAALTDCFATLNPAPTNVSG